MSTYYALTNQNVFIQYKNPITLNSNSDYQLFGYLTNFGDSNTNYSSSPNKILDHVYTNEGVYFISYSALYAFNNQVLTYAYTTLQPFVIKNNWKQYNPSEIRLNEEITLELPYTFEQIEIQPNEWGVEDIFNTSIFRLQECLDYLKAKTQTINTYSPTLFYGWLGNNTGTKASNLKWFTQSYNSFYVNKPELSKSTGLSYFTNILDAIETENFLYILDNNELKFYTHEAEPKQIKTTLGDQLSSFLVEPISFDINEDGSVLYIADKIKNNVYKLGISLDINDQLNINVQLFVGGFGGLIDNNNFNTPTQICYNTNNIYVLDYNNFCIKQFNQDLNWIYTYNIENFTEEKPISITVLKNGLLYVLTEKYNVYIFDQKSNEIFEYFSVFDVTIEDKSNLVKITTNQTEDFIYLITENSIYKYTLTGVFITKVNIIKGDTVKFKNIKRGKDQTILISSQNCILKFHDILETFKLGEGLPYRYWSKDQLSVNKNEFSSDLIYNRSLIRITQNIKSFRDTLNSKFVIATENIKDKVISYFSYIPINYGERPIFINDLEEETLGVGVNELHVPSVINKELEKIYNALLTVTDFLNIKNYEVQNLECIKTFCWSWDATSCFNLKLPVLKTCSINPISYVELDQSKNNDLIYAPNTTWDKAVSDCCKKNNT
jgi:hypothetical protein